MSLSQGHTFINKLFPPVTLPFFSDRPTGPPVPPLTDFLLLRGDTVKCILS